MRDRDEWLYNTTRDLVEGLGFRLVDAREKVQDGRRVLVFFIDGARGVSLDDCAAVSRELGYLLDAEPSYDAGYVLEVSSPGLDHDLRNEREYNHFAGRRARLVVRGGEERGGVVTGAIVRAADGSVVIDTDEGGQVTLELTDVVRARLVIEEMEPRGPKERREMER